VCIVDLQVNTDDLKMLSNTQHCLNDEYMSPETINILGSSSKAPEIFVQFRQNLDFLNNFHEIFQFKFYGRSLSDTCGQMDIETEGRMDLKN
jgi:hypothetical protein